MTHESEHDFAAMVGDWFRHHYGDENVTQEYRLPSGRRADFLIDGPFVNFAVEVENDFEAVFKGVGQTLLYAAEVAEDSFPAVPVVVVPSGHVEEPEVTYLRQRVAVVELPRGDDDLPGDD